jgi:FtsZ-binding cell division protein ZapB
MSMIDLQELEKKLLVLIEKYEIAKMEIEDLNSINSELLHRESELKRQLDDYKKNISSIIGKIDTSVEQEAEVASVTLEGLAVKEAQASSV